MNFNALHALNSVSLELQQGEILGLVGPNGSGKTTLINVVTGFLKPTLGHVFVDDLDITALPPNKIAGCGVARTFQTMRLFKELTVLENVEVAAVCSGFSRRLAEKRAYEILKEMGLDGIANNRSGNLAYGDMRRVEIARATATKPKFLLLDEPAGGLSDAESDNLIHILKDFPHRMNCGILIIDHDMRLIMRLCDRMHVLNHGLTIGEGTPEEVRKNDQVIKAYLGTSIREV